MADTDDLYFVLRADGCIHSSDVRHVSSADGVLLTASRDCTATITPAPPLTDTFTEGMKLVGHTKFVNFVLFHPFMPLLEGEPCIVTGSNDNHVALWNLQTAALEAVLDGHAHGVCCGAVVLQNGGDIVTGDWGGMCAVFDSTTGAVRQCYTEHKTVVRAVVNLPGTNSVVSVSGDKEVHQWDVLTGKTTAVFVGHKDVVQCVCAMSATRFATGGNDAMILIWDTTAGTTPLHALVAHDSLVYSLCYCPARRLLFSASEDRTVKVWRGGAVDVAKSDSLTETVVAQSINHPCVVWSVCVTGTGDIATGCADGVLRLWTTEDEKMASVPKLEALHNAVAAQMIDLRVVTEMGFDMASVLSVDGLHLRRGSREGERQFVRTEAGLIEMHTWNHGRWDMVGIVVEGPEKQAFTGAPRPRAKTSVNGVPHDYVFDVDVNGHMLKLTYDKNQSVYDAAQNFINENRTVVSQTHKEEIQNFILKNVDPGDLPQGSGLPPTASGLDGGAEPVFSGFAQEAAALRQAGQSHVLSWSEALRNLERAGPSADSLVYSAYAREGACLQSRGTTTTTSAARAENATGGIARWEGYKLFTSFNAAGAQKKIDEWAGDAQFGGLVQRALAAAESGEANRALLDDVMALYRRLPESSRFPAVDVLSHVLAVTTRPLGWVQLLLGDDDGNDGSGDGGGNSPTQAFVRERVEKLHQVADAEVLVTIRLFAHVVAALGKLPPEVTLGSNQLSLLLLMLTKAPQSFLSAKNSNIKSSISALMRNAAVLLVQSPSVLAADGVRDVTQGVVRVVAKWLIFEPISSPFTRELVATLMTLMLSDNNEASRNVAVEAGRGALLHTLRALKEGAEPHCQEAAKVLLNVLNG